MRGDSSLETPGHPRWLLLPLEGDVDVAASQVVEDLIGDIASRDFVTERELRAQLGEARVAGVEEVYAQVDLIRGMPVSAGLTVTRQQVAGRDEALLTGLGAVLGTSEGVVESGPVRLENGLPALRRVRRFQHVVTEGTPPQGQTAVEWVVVLPDCDDVLVLAFATSTPQVADALVMLFDAVARSLEISPRPAAG